MEATAKEMAPIAPSQPDQPDTQPDIECSPLIGLFPLGGKWYIRFDNALRVCPLKGCGKTYARAVTLRRHFQSKHSAYAALAHTAPERKYLTQDQKRKRWREKSEKRRSRAKAKRSCIEQGPGKLQSTQHESLWADACCP